MIRLASDQALNKFPGVTIRVNPCDLGACVFALLLRPTDHTDKTGFCGI